MKTLIELREEIAAKSKKLNGIFEEAGPDRDFAKVKSLEGDTKGKVEHVQGLMRELDELTVEVEKVKSLDNAAQKAADLNRNYNEPAKPITFPNAGEPPIERKSLGQLIMEKKSLLTPGAGSFTVPFEVKTLFQTSTGWPAESTRISRVELYPLRPIVVVDYIPQAPLAQAALVVMVETTATIAGAEKAEAAAYAEAAFALTQSTFTARKITSSLPVTDEQLADVPAAEAYINQRLGYDIRQRLDKAVLEGNAGATPAQVEGTLYVSGINSTALGSDSVPDAIYKAFDQVRTVGFAEPSVLFINPADWQPVRLLTTADGIYLFGSPMDAGPDRIWGKPVVQTTAVTANTALCGDYTAFSTLYIRTGLEISAGYVNDDFTKGTKTIRADMRVAMVHFRAKAFAKITGI